MQVPNARVYPQWWGAKGDGVADDTDAISVLVAVIERHDDIHAPDAARVIAEVGEERTSVDDLPPVDGAQEDRRARLQFADDRLEVVAAMPVDEEDADESVVPRKPIPSFSSKAATSKTPITADNTP